MNVLSALEKKMLSIVSIESLICCSTLLTILFRSSEFVFTFDLLNVP